jgi:hypothetical protein
MIKNFKSYPLNDTKVAKGAGNKTITVFDKFLVMIIDKPSSIEASPSGFNIKGNNTLGYAIKNQYPDITPGMMLGKDYVITGVRLGWKYDVLFLHKSVNYS